MANRDGKFVEVDGRYIWVPSEKQNTRSKSVVDDELLDWVIREEGFIDKPTNIGDGKITLGSGLTDPKWHSLYKKRGNKWSEEDNRAAVREELEKRKKWAEDTVPNWDSLPEHSQKAVLSYKYNFDFTPKNSPLLFQAMTDGRFIDAMYQMDATSKDPKFKKGLEKRRKREQEWGITELLEKPKKYIVEDRYAEEYPDRTNVVNMYTQGFNAVKPKPVTVPTSINNYVEAVTLQNERPTLDAVDAIKALRSITEFNNSMKWENHSEGPKFVPVYDIPDSYGDGGQLRKDWNSLSQAEKSDVMKLAVQNGITDLDTIRNAYNEFASGGSIHINPSKKGTFTAAASKHGKSVQGFASQVLVHKENYSPAMVKKANFARNASKWHGLGGNLFEEGGNTNFWIDAGLSLAKAFGLDKKYKGKPEDFRYKQNLYSIIDPTTGFPQTVEDAIDFKRTADAARNPKNSLKYTRKYRDDTADAGWAKRLGLPYDKNLLIDNPDRSVRLSKAIEAEIPTDTLFLENRIKANEELLSKYRKNNAASSERVKLINDGIRADKQALDALRLTYKTGKPVVINEDANNSRRWIIDSVPSWKPSPLNILHNYTIQYDKDKNVMNYYDLYDFNEFEDFVPGNPYTIKGSIKLKK